MATETVYRIGGGNVHKYRSNGSAALSDTTGALDQCAGFKSMSVHMGSAPATAENLTVTLDSVAGGSFDAVLFTGAMNGITDLVVDTQDFDVVLGRGDALDFAWTNTDSVAYGIEVTLVEGIF